MNRQRAITVAMFLLMLLLGWDFTNSVILYSPAGYVPDSSSTTEDAEAGSEDGYVRPVYTYGAILGDEIVEYNVFSQERGEMGKKLTEAALPAGSLPGDMPVPEGQWEIDRPDVKLSGIIKNQFGEYVAYIQVADEPSVGIRVGEVIQGIRAIEIEERSVTLGWRDTTFDLNLSTPLLKR